MGGAEVAVVEDAAATAAPTALASEASAGEDGMRMEGWLYLIRSNRFGLQYSRKRYFVLEDATLRCFKSPPASKREVNDRLIRASLRPFISLRPRNCSEVFHGILWGPRASGIGMIVTTGIRCGVRTEIGMLITTADCTRRTVVVDFIFILDHRYLFLCMRGDIVPPLQFYFSL